MGLQNVEKIETQQNHEKSWFQRFKYKMGAAAGATTALAVSTSSNAFLKFLNLQLLAEPFQVPNQQELFLNHGHCLQLVELLWL